MSLLRALLALLLATGLAGAAPKKHAPPLRRVVFVHGIFQNGDMAFGTLRHRLESEGIECFAPTLCPADCRGGLDELAVQLKTQIDRRWGPKARFSLVGFSMGGLVARYYLQEMGGAPRCESLITVSCPHRGTLLAWFHPGKGAWQMRPGSDFLRELDRTEGRLGRMPAASYRTPYDWVVLPSDSSVWPRADDNRRFAVAGHVFMTRAEKVMAAIEERLLDSAHRR